MNSGELRPVFDDLGDLLIGLGKRVRHQLLGPRDIETDSLVVGHQAGDTIYALDREVERTIIAVVENWPDAIRPVLIVAEGLGSDGQFMSGDPNQPLRYRLLIDPIDGTRNLMYDKRSAWFLAAIAPDNGEDTFLSASVASVIVELPPSKQLWADDFLFVKGRPIVCNRTRIDTEQSSELVVRPSRAADLLNGFGQVANFFPGTKVLAAELMEMIVQSTLGQGQTGQATVFDDQYISTGGQFVELMLGHDRFCCDLRPLFYDILERRNGTKIPRGLECHPYDIAGFPVAESAGVILTDGFGRQLDAPFDTTHPVHWCGYANEELRVLIEPVIQEWLRRNLGD
ncbi:inositol monophosphatase [Pelagibius marinus]|uniref:inositol monophosphatase n=1 Tax=Pelagibius marinus TaxID=2762760 RepID=UPI001872CF84|nr:inositol monophosphatase [Pelagibius marinus]